MRVAFSVDGLNPVADANRMPTDAEADWALIRSVMADHPGLTEDEAIDILEYFGGLGSMELIERAHASRKCRCGG